jgi:hypothetical protein
VRPAPAALAAGAGVALCAAAIASPFATRVIAYDPAPGQFVRSAPFNDPARALGPPGSNGSALVADNTKVVSLGGLGGTITLGFDRPVWRNRFNPHGADLIVYGNAFFAGGDPLRRFGECGVIEISRDDNVNGVADDAWYLIPGSELATPISRETIAYDPATLNPAWVPAGRVGGGVWTMTVFRIVSPAINAPLLINPRTDGVEAVFGYADLQPTLALGDLDADGAPDDPLNLPPPGAFYTVPDDPLTVGISPGSGGGSAVRIAWAVDPATGAPANLDRIDFVRITTAAAAPPGVLGEISTEVSAVADVRPSYTPDWNQSGAVTIDDIFIYLADWFAGAGEAGGADFGADGVTSIDDIFIFLNAWFAASP